MILAGLLLALTACGGGPAAAAQPAAETSAAEACARGGAALSGGDWAGAAEAYRQALEREPGAEDAERGLIAALTGAGDTAGLVSAYEELYATGRFTLEDFAALAAAYGDRGETVRQRDMLEKRYRLSPDAAALEKLNAVVADTAQETEEVRQLMDGLETSLAAGDDGAAAETLLSDAWAVALLPPVRTECRRYLSGGQTAVPLRVETGFGADGAAYTRLWYGAEGAVRFLAVSGSGLTAASLTRTDGAYTGAFACTGCETASGKTYTDQGTLTNGLLTGSYTSAVGTGEAGTPAAELFAQASAQEKTTYTGTFSGDGRTQEEQQTAVTGSAGVVYAYNAERTAFLYMTFSADATPDTAVFDCSMFGVPAYPAW